MVLMILIEIKGLYMYLFNFVYGTNSLTYSIDKKFKIPYKSLIYRGLPFRHVASLKILH